MDPARDISRSEKIEKELDVLIHRRHEKRVRSEGERREEEVYAESVQRFNAKREREMHEKE